MHSRTWRMEIHVLRVYTVKPIPFRVLALTRGTITIGWEQVRLDWPIRRPRWQEQSTTRHQEYTRTVHSGKALSCHPGKAHTFHPFLARAVLNWITTNVRQARSEPRSVAVWIHPLFRVSIINTKIELGRSHFRLDSASMLGRIRCQYWIHFNNRSQGRRLLVRTHHLILKARDRCISWGIRSMLGGPVRELCR